MSGRPGRRHDAERSPSGDGASADDTGPAAGPGESVEIPVTGDLDLHPFAPRDVLSVVAEYVRACRERDILEVRLAHGKGRGVQRAAVRHALLQMPEVLTVEDAPPQSGAWGATIARLRPRRPE